MTIASLIVDVQAQTASIDAQTKQLNATLDTVASKADIAGEAIGSIGRMLTGAFSIGAIVNVAKEIAAFAGDTQDASLQLGISVTKVQALDYALAGAKLTVDDAATGMAQLSKRLIGGNDGAVKALDSLGLSSQAIINMPFDEALSAIVAAAGGIPNPMQQSALMMELFGRSGSKYLRLVQDDLLSLEGEAQRNGAVISRELIEKGDRLDDTWARLKIRGKALVGDVLIPMMDVLNGKANSDYSIFGQIDRFFGSGTQQSLDNITKTLQGPVYSGPGAFKPLAMSMHDADMVSRDLDEHTKELIRTEDAAAKKQKEWDDGISQHETVTRYWLATLKMTTPEVHNMAGEIENLIPETESYQGAIEKITNAMDKGTPAIHQNATEIRALEASMHPQVAKDFTSAIASGFAAIGPAIVNALQGGGNILKSIGSAAGLQFTEHMFGKGSGIAASITKNFSGALGGMVNALLPGIGALMGPLLSKIGGLFANIFGGPDAAEKAGRAATDAFTQSLASSLDWMQKIEVHQLVAQGNNEKWATQVVAIRDAYIKAGHSTEEALAMVDRLFKAEKQGGNAVQLVIDEITMAMHDSIPAAADTATKAIDGATGGVIDFGSAVDDATTRFHALGGVAMAIRDVIAQPIDIQVRYVMETMPDLQSPHVGGGAATQSDIEAFLRNNPGDAGRIATAFGNITDPNLAGYGHAYDAHGNQIGYAGGSNGVRDFGAGTSVTLHGREEVRTEAQASADGSLLTEIRGLRRDLPRALRLAMRDGMVLAGA